MSYLILGAIGAFFKKHWVKILLAVIIAILCGGVYYFYDRMRDQKLRADRMDEIVYQTTVQYQDAQGHWVTESTEQRMTIEELQRKSKIDSAGLGVLLKKIAESNIKLKNVESLAQSTISVHDTLWWQPPTGDTIPENSPKHFKNNYFDCYNISEKGLVCDYQDTLVWSVVRYHMDKFKFKNLFVKRPWYYKLFAKYGNPSAKINYQQYYKIEGKNSRRKK